MIMRTIVFSNDKAIEIEVEVSPYSKLTIREIGMVSSGLEEMTIDYAIAVAETLMAAIEHAQNQEKANASQSDT